MNSSPHLNRFCLAVLCAGFFGSHGGLYAQQRDQQRDQQKDQQRDQQPGQPHSSSGQTNSLQNLTSEKFVKKAAVGGLKEIHVSQLALQRAQNAQVKSFAQEIITDHQKANQQLMHIAQSKSIQLPPTNLFTTLDSNRQYVREKDQPGTRNRPDAQPDTRPAQKATPGQADADETMRLWNIDQEGMEATRGLQTATGAQFDQQYISAMVRDHQKAIQLFEAANNLPDAELKTFAQSTLPTLKHHLQKAQELAREVGAPTTSGDQNQAKPQGQREQNPATPDRPRP